MFGLALVVGLAGWRFFPVDPDSLAGGVSDDGSDKPKTLAGETANAIKRQPLLPSDASPALRAFVDPSADNRLPVDLQYQIPKVSDAGSVAAVVAVLRDRDEGDTIRHEAANLLRRSEYAELEQVLLECLQHPEETERFRSWAVQHLFAVFEARKGKDPQGALTIMQPLLADPAPAVRREALLSLHRLELPGGPDTVATAATWLADPATADLALRIIRESDARQYLPQVRALLTDQTATQPTTIAAIVTLSQWQDLESLPALQEFANLPDQPANFRLRRSAQMALERFASNGHGKSDPERAVR